MNCAYEHCIYNQNGQSCRLSRICIDRFGLCEDCVLVQLPQAELCAQKQANLSQLADENSALEG